MTGTPKEKPRREAAPTSNGPEAARIFQNEAGARLVARVVRELLGKARFEDATQLRDAVEARCRELRLACTRDQVERALDLVGSNVQLLAATRKPPIRPPVPDAVPPVKHAEAKALLDKLDVDVRGGRLQKRATPSRLVAL